jgi:ATP-dependent DNA ligase
MEPRALRRLRLWPALRARSCLIDGEAITFEHDGLASFEPLRGRRHDKQVTLCAFDLIARGTHIENIRKTVRNRHAFFCFHRLITAGTPNIGG